MNYTEWIYGILGGLMIGTAGAMFLLVNGRILGPSGILGGLVDGSGRKNCAERLSFIVGLIGAATLVAMLMGRANTEITDNLSVVAVAGVLVGVGTRVGNGCVGGHAVCGISRFSPRSITATATFVAAGAVSVFVFRHLLGVI